MLTLVLTLVLSALHLSFPAQAMVDGRPYNTVEALFCESHFVGSYRLHIVASSYLES